MRTGFSFIHALPRRPATYGEDASLTTIPSWPAASASASMRSPSAGSVVSTLGMTSGSAIARQPRCALLERRVEQVVAVDVQEVEEKRDHTLRRRLGVDPRHRVLERGRPIVPHPQRLAVEHRLADGEPADRRDDSRQGGSDVVEVAGVDANLVAAAVDLDADPVELPFHGRAPEARDCLGRALGGRGEHREHRAKQLEADGPQPLLALDHRDCGGAGEVAREHERAPRELGANARRLRDGVDHQPRECALPELAGEEAPDEVALGLRRACEQLAEQRPACTSRTGARQCPHLVDHPVELMDGE